MTLTPGGITAGGIIFQNQAYTISGSTLTLAGATPTITTNATGGTISSVLAGTAGLAMSGPGLLTLTGNNSYTGPTAINNGTLALSGAIAGGSTISVGNGVAGAGGTFNVVQSTYSGTNSNALVLNGGTVTITGPYNVGSGGALTFSGVNAIQTFTATGTSSLTLPVAETAQVLVVGGGGGGGAASDRTGGGGGGGGVLLSTLSLASSTYTVTVGAGGAGAVNGGAGGGNGGSSVFGSLTARGGGFGADSNHLQAGTGNGTVGSGGGAYHNASSTKGTGTTGQGNSGGSGYDGGTLYGPFSPAAAAARAVTAANGKRQQAGALATAESARSYNISGADRLLRRRRWRRHQVVSATYAWPGGTGGLGGGARAGAIRTTGRQLPRSPAPTAWAAAVAGPAIPAMAPPAAPALSSSAMALRPAQVTLTGPISVPVTSTLNANGNIVVDSAMSGAGGINIASASPGGMVSYALAQSYSGNTTVNAGATLQMGASNALPYGAGMGNVNLGGTLDLFGQTTTNVNGLSGSGLVTSSAVGASQLIVGNNGASSTFGGVFQNGSGTLGLALAGPGTLVLTGNNTYTGGTTVSGGVLQIATSISAQPGQRGPAQHRIGDGRQRCDDRYRDGQRDQPDDLKFDQHRGCRQQWSGSTRRN